MQNGDKSTGMQILHIQVLRTYAIPGPTLLMDSARAGSAAQAAVPLAASLRLSGPSSSDSEIMMNPQLELAAAAAGQPFKSP
jgi:hypothetical protein